MQVMRTMSLRSSGPTSSCLNRVSNRIQTITRFLDFVIAAAKIEVRTYRGGGIRHPRGFSSLQLQSSYTLIEHAPWESIQLEIVPFAMEQAHKLRQACETRTMARSSNF